MVIGRCQDFQFIEKGLGHVVIVVLSGVDDSAGYFGESQGGPVNGGDFHKIRAGAGNQKDVYCSLLPGHLHKSVNNFIISGKFAI